MSSIPEQPSRNIWRNYFAHALDGGLFIGAMALINQHTLLPSMVRDLGGPNILISAMPILMMVGFMAPPIFTAHLIDRMPRYMPLLLMTGIFQRLPYLIAGLVLVFGIGGNWLALAVIAAAPFVSGVCGGVSVTAWQQLISNTVADNRRPSLLALRDLLACLFGVGAGWIVKDVLEKHPGNVGFGILHLYAMGLLVLSYIVFYMIREPGGQDQEEVKRQSLRENLKSVPVIIRADRNLLLLLGSNVFMCGIFVMVPWLAIYARTILNMPDSYLGDLLIFQMLGAIAGNIVCGLLGDRCGSKIIMYLGRVSFIFIPVFAVYSQTDFGFRALFLLFGFGLSARRISTLAFPLEICPREGRATFLAILSLINLPSMLLFTLFSSVLWSGPESFRLIVIVTGVCAGLSLAFTVPIRKVAE